MSAPATLDVSILPTDVEGGVFSGSIALIPLDGGIPTTIPVTYIATPQSASPSSIRLSQTVLLFTHQQGGTPPPGQEVRVSAAQDAAVHFSASTTTPWLMLRQSGADAGGTTISGTAPQAIVVLTDPGALPAGTHTGDIQVASDGGILRQITVTLSVSSTPVLTAHPGAVVLEQSTTGTIRITDPSPGAHPIEASASSLGDWLSVSAIINTQAGEHTVRVTADPARLATGVNAGTITIRSSQTAPLIVPVQITRRGNTGTSTFTFSPQSVLFRSLEDANENPTMTVQVVTEDGSRQDYTAAASSTGNWLAVEPFQGTAPGLLNMSAILRYVAGPGTYEGKVTITSLTTGQQYTLPVTLEVVPNTISVDASTVTFATSKTELSGRQTLRIMAPTETAFRLELPRWVNADATSGTTSISRHELRDHSRH
jgi:hypothetical protein